MTRHGKNATASSVYSYHERQRDTEESGYGTQNSRVGKDSVKDFDACSMTLQLCKNPMITPEGHVYDKEAVLQYIVTQKSKIRKDLKKFEKQQKRDARDLKELAEAEVRSKVDQFVTKDNSVTTNTETFQNKPKTEVASSVKTDLKHLPSFWVPCLTPAADKTKVKKPEDKVLCPMSGKPLIFKKLIPIKFTPIADRNTTTSTISKTARWQCAVTHDTLGNSVPCAVLRTTGDVVTQECVDRIMRLDAKVGEDGKMTMLHPLTGETLREKDIIPLQRGGTGYSHTNEGLKTKSYRPVLMVC